MRFAVTTYNAVDVTPSWHVQGESLVIFIEPSISRIGPALQLVKIHTFSNRATFEVESAVFVLIAVERGDCNNCSFFAALVTECGVKFVRISAPTTMDCAHKISLVPTEDEIAIFRLLAIFRCDVGEDALNSMSLRGRKEQFGQ